MKLNKHNLEVHSFVEKLTRIISVPILNSLNTYVKSLMRKTSGDAGRVVETSGTTHALEVMYSRYERSIFEKGFFSGLANYFWHHFVSQPAALRNRLKIVKKMVLDELEDRLSNANCVNIANIGGGSSRAIIETLKLLSRDYYVGKVKITSIDKDNSAIELSKTIAKNNDLYENFHWIQGSASNYNNYIPKKTVDIAEMVGLMDYFNDEKAILIARMIHDSLRERGVFIVANVTDNSEKMFVKKMGWPKMYYRDCDQLVKILYQSGFSKIREYTFEPLGVHIIIKASK